MGIKKRRATALAVSCPPAVPERMLDVVSLPVCAIRPNRPQNLVLGCVEHSFAERRRSCVSTHSERPNQAAIIDYSFDARHLSALSALIPLPSGNRDNPVEAIQGGVEMIAHQVQQPMIKHRHQNPSCDDSEREESPGSEEEPKLDFSPPQPPKLSPICQGKTLEHHLRQDILAAEEAMKRNQDNIRFITNCQSELGPNYPWTNCFLSGSKILAKNESLLAETLLILTAALEDIPDSLCSCDCHFVCEKTPEMER